jgi:hypothetical protein
MLMEVLLVALVMGVVEVGRLTATAKMVVIAEDWGLYRYNITRPACIPYGSTVVGSTA